MNTPRRRDIALSGALLALCAADLVLELLTTDPIQTLPHPVRAITGVALGTVVLVAAAAWWRAQPLIAVSGILCSFIVVVSIGAPPGGMPQSAALPLIVISYGAAAWLPQYRAVAALVMLVLSGPVADIVTDQGNDVAPLLIYTVGPWLIGWVVRSRRELVDQLDRVARELDTERRRFAESAVLLERRRAARELHDLVGHAMSIVIIQASAGRHLADARPHEATEALDAVEQALAQARTELGFLDDLVDEPSRARPGLSDVPHLIDRTGMAGLAVAVTGLPIPAQLSDEVDAAAYRVVQEALTNVLRHAPGQPAALDLHVVDQRSLEITVTNHSATDGSRRFTTTSIDSGGTGLAGLQDRVTDLGGALTVDADGPTWCLQVRLPIDSRTTTSTYAKAGR